MLFLLPIVLLASPLDAREEDLPASTCEDRIAQLKQLARSPFRAPLIDAGLVSVPSPRVIDVLAPVLDDASVVPDAAQEMKSQKRARAVVYWKLRPELSAGELVDGIKRLSAALEVRLLVAREGDGPLVASSHAWTQPLRAFAALPFTTAFEGDDELCPGSEDAARVAEEKRPEEQFSALANGIAHALKHCGCPRLYSELAFARVVHVADAWGRAGWIPANLTDYGGAETLKLKRTDSSKALVLALATRTKALHIEWLK